MKLNLPGLIKEKMPSGAYRWRVRVEGQKTRRIVLKIDSSHPEFMEHYHAARRGIQLKPTIAPLDRAVKYSMSWLMLRHEERLTKMVKNGERSEKTLKKRKQILKALHEKIGQYSMDIPRSEVVKLRDDLSSRPSWADDTISALRIIYNEAIQDGLIEKNPIQSIKKISKSKGGALPWTLEDLKKYKTTFPPGTNQYLLITILMFTGCRIGDAVNLGRQHEKIIDGIRVLSWQPSKKGSAHVTIPMLPPLLAATQDIKIIGPTYMLTEYGQPFKNADCLGQFLKKSCKKAGLVNLSAHGVRKAAGTLLAEAGCTTYEIMSVLGHSESQTTEIYTKKVRRQQLAVTAMDKIRSIDW